MSEKNPTPDSGEAPAYVGGAASKRRRGLRSLLVALRPEVYDALALAAAGPPRQAMSAFAAAAIEAAIADALLRARREKKAGQT